MPLFIASIKGHVDAMGVLLAAKADINQAAVAAHVLGNMFSCLCVCAWICLRL